MRYINATKSPKFNAIANSVLEPGGRSGEITDLRDVLERLSDGSGLLSIQLSKRDLEALDRFMSKVGVDKERVREAARKGRRDPRGENEVYEALEKSYIEKRKALSRKLADRRERERRVNMESNFILPDGTPVERHAADPVSAAGAKVELRIVEAPSSPLDILAHNAKVSSDRAQYAPLSGKAAVVARKGIPGMPNLPGVDKQMDNLLREAAMASAQKAGIPVVSSADMLRDGESSNYGRKP